MTRETDSLADRYYIGGAGLPSTTPGHPFPFSEARRFQRIALEWIHDDDVEPPVTALAAPTGGGKTATIAALAETANAGTVCTYPTNTLIQAQTEALQNIEGCDLTVTPVTGKTLSGSGVDRSDELLGLAQQTEDVLVTNPDILQAIAQNSYFSPGGRILEFFSNFDAAVFDEFHYYDPLAASGLLMQIRILSQRGRYLDREGTEQFPRVLLTSATPDEEFVAAITEDFGIDAQLVRSRLVSLDLADPAPKRVPPPHSDLLYEPVGTPPGRPNQLNQLPAERTDPETLVGDVPEGVSRFRYPMVLNRWSTWIGDAFDDIAAMLAAACEGWTPGDDPVGAVVFNSAARSNAFATHLDEVFADLASVTKKDNGYDTRAKGDEKGHGEFAVLNTTSKGEVGLDFDLRRLVVAAPRTATAFVQRVGRAARRSPATVDVFGLDDPTWPPVQSYAGFLARVLERFQTPSTSRRRLRELAGMRAGRAIQQRYDDPTYHADIEKDFEDIPGCDRWRAFLCSLEEVADTDTGSFGGPTLGASGRRAIEGASRAVEGLDSLRGRSVQEELIYPVSGGTQQTEYDLGRALRHYPIEEVGDDGTLRLGRGTPTDSLTGTYPEEPFGGLDLRQSDWDIERRLTDAYRDAASTADLRQFSVDGDVLEWLFAMLPLQRAMLPTALVTDRYRLTIDQEFGGVTRIDDRR